MIGTALKLADLLAAIPLLIELARSILEKEPDVKDEALVLALDDALKLNGLAEALDGPILTAAVKVARFVAHRRRTNR